MGWTWFYWSSFCTNVLLIQKLFSATNTKKADLQCFHLHSVPSLPWKQTKHMELTLYSKMDMLYVTGKGKHFTNIAHLQLLVNKANNQTTGTQSSKTPGPSNKGTESRITYGHWTDNVIKVPHYNTKQTRRRKRTQQITQDWEAPKQHFCFSK